MGVGGEVEERWVLFGWGSLGSLVVVGVVVVVGWWCKWVC